MTLHQLLRLVRVNGEDDRVIVNAVKKSVGR